MFNLSQYLSTRQKFLQAKDLMRQIKYEDAIQVFDKIKSNQSYQTAQLFKAAYLFFLERFEDALRIYDNVPLQNKCFSEAQFYKGKTLFTIEKYAEAIEAFNNVNVDLNSNSLFKSWSQCYKGKSLIMIEKYNEAIEAFNNIQVAHPSYQVTQYLIKIIHLIHIKDYNSAMQALDYIKEDLPEINLLKGACLLMQQKYNLPQMTVQNFITKSDVHKSSELTG